MGEYGRLLRQRSFLFLYLGQACSRLGDGVFQIVVTWTVWEATGSPALVALALAFQTVPPLLFSFAAGVAADRYPHRGLMIAADAARLAVTLPLAYLGWAGMAGHWHLMVAAFLLTSGATFFGPARAAMVPRLVPPDHLEAANGLMSGSFVGVRLAGQLAGGWLLPLVGAPALTLLNGLTFAVSLATLLALPGDTRSGAPVRRSLSGDLRAGLAAIRDAPALRWVVGTFGLGTFLSGGVAGVGQTLLMDTLGAGAAGLGLMGTAMGMGVVAGSFLCGRGARAFPLRVVFSAWATEGVLMALMGVSPTLAAAVALAFGSGVATAYINVPTESLIQRHGGAHTGKVFSLWHISIWLGETLSLSLLAPLFGLFPLPVVMAGAGLGLVALALAARRLSGRPGAPAARAAG